MQTQFIIEAQIRQRPDGTVGVLGESGYVTFGGVYADVIWADYQRQLTSYQTEPKQKSRKLEMQILLEVEVMEPY